VSTCRIRRNALRLPGRRCCVPALVAAPAWGPVSRSSSRPGSPVLHPQILTGHTRTRWSGPDPNSGPQQPDRTPARISTNHLGQPITERYPLFARVHRRRPVRWRQPLLAGAGPNAAAARAYELLSQAGPPRWHPQPACPILGARPDAHPPWRRAGYLLPPVCIFSAGGAVRTRRTVP
jgi:hypothetical protein